MRLAPLFIAGVLAAEPYFFDSRGETDLNPYSIGDDLPLECIKRNIHDGEHMVDEKTQEILYEDFPICRETGKPLSLQYRVDQDVNCTIGFSDTLYHLFQLYIHEDAPFSCRLRASKQKNKNVLSEPTTWLPLTFTIRGHIQESHLDIDPKLNAVMMYSRKTETPVVAAAFSRGTETERYKNGDFLPLQLSVKWYPGSNNNEVFTLPANPDSNSAFSSTTLMWCAATMIATAAIVTVVFQGVIFPRKLRSENFGTPLPRFADWGSSKKD
ncbi:hypothetical protein B0I72DRAFT_134294 [Yarrowia lipolytica]|jgi:hypothetical protein|uniref:YALI0F14399p n=2 Tax=Yarrowia lipolytica TaxID=4952 RepID=Q6C1Q1_YARLI|nr:YALI0F14399p [Yarrowia lipolytica CLIB122]AOW07174.1 hypothetical protein YALI1_F19216g [Yarrowia lipolytica]KAB8281692.1 hypothetical protein BKA91DRAFT_139730 [Yarrowia lipolytica]KAE8171913.1 hypothetical protein BKA90DRAFT_138197 [Yarrowia lipolytica]KAJ8055710.1 hypothetical protein LXG23DRAFT_57245 [Yarrowia lipolytica]QNQ01144.1 Hypothetical protein YALI2_F00689g [Yarrowia lipolytica]|eukprot:XP_505411.1 YALI0F14399p [Yarrowia lipolytica CLIB122]